MPEPKRPLKVFLCHAHADRDPVRGLYARLTKDGVDAWLDKAKLLPGQDWELEIRKAVREADVVVVCLSKQFNQAGFRQKEVRLALDTAMEKPEGEIFIIPARLEECDNLESLRKWHWVDLFEDDGYEMLMRAFRARADKIGATLQTKKSWLPTKENQFIVSQKSKSKEVPKPKALENDNVAKNAWENARQVYDKTIEENNRHVASLERKYKWNKFLSDVYLKFRIYAPLRIFILVVIVGLIYLLSYVMKNMPLQEVSPTSSATFTAQPIFTLTEDFIPTETFLPTSTQTISLMPTFSAPFNYTVQNGDYLTLISEKFSLGDDGVAKILSLNPYVGTSEQTGLPIGIDPTTQNVIPGQIITVPNPGYRLPTVTPVSPNIPRGTKIIYIVQSGDSMASIVTLFNSTEEAIIKENNITDPNALLVGQSLVIPVNMAIMATPIN